MSITRDLDVLGGYRKIRHRGLLTFAARHSHSGRRSWVRVIGRRADLHGLQTFSPAGFVHENTPAERCAHLAPEMRPRANSPGRRSVRTARPVSLADVLHVKPCEQLVGRICDGLPPRRPTCISGAVRDLIQLDPNTLPCPKLLSTPIHLPSVRPAACSRRGRCGAFSRCLLPEAVNDSNSCATDRAQPLPESLTLMRCPGRGW